MADQGFSVDDKDFISALIRTYFPSAKILCFGSRQRGDHKPFSDLDLCLNNKTPLSLTLLGELKEALSTSFLAYKVDLVDWNRITSDFQKLILDDCEPW